MCVCVSEVLRSCSSLCRAPCSRPWAVCSCVLSTREERSPSREENCSICSITTVRDLDKDSGITNRYQKLFTRTCCLILKISNECRTKSICKHTKYIIANGTDIVTWLMTYLVWDVALVTASISSSFSFLSLWIWSSWSFFMSKIDFLYGKIGKTWQICEKRKGS